MTRSLESYRTMLNDFSISDLSDDGLTTFAACLQEAQDQTAMDFGTTDNVTRRLQTLGWSVQKVGGHINDLIEKGYIWGEHIRVNGQGPRFYQYDVEQKFKDAVWSMEQEPEPTKPTDEVRVACTNTTQKPATEPVTVREAGTPKGHAIPGRHLPAQVAKATSDFVAGLRTQVTKAEAILAKFTEDFATNPAYAFEWAQSKMEAAAGWELATRLLSLFDDEDRDTPATLDQCVDHLRREVDRMAQSPEFSTSVTSNVMSQYRLAAAANLLRKAEGRRW